MKHDGEARGGFPVAAFDGLPGSEQILVMVLRQWSDGPEGGARVARLLAAGMGAPAAARCRRALVEVMGILSRHGRRRLVRHRPGCSCVGADEAVFAHFVMMAATAEREDAMLVGSLMVEAPFLPALTEAARQAGLHLYRAGLGAPQDRAGGVAPRVH